MQLHINSVYWWRRRLVNKNKRFFVNTISQTLAIRKQYVCQFNWLQNIYIFDRNQAHIRRDTQNTMWSNSRTLVRMKPNEYGRQRNCEMHSLILTLWVWDCEYWVHTRFVSVGVLSFELKLHTATMFGHCKHLNLRIL